MRTDTHSPIFPPFTCNTLNMCTDPYKNPRPCTTHAQEHTTTDPLRSQTYVPPSTRACAQPSDDPIGRRGLHRPQRRNLVPIALPSDASGQRSPRRWRWHFLSYRKARLPDPTKPCGGCVRRPGLWASRGPRGAAHCSRSGGEDGAERPQARRSPPRVRLERPRASAEQLAGLGPGRAARRRREVSRAVRPGLGSRGWPRGRERPRWVGRRCGSGWLLAGRGAAPAPAAGGDRPAGAGAGGLGLVSASRFAPHVPGAHFPSCPRGGWISPTELRLG